MNDTGLPSLWKWYKIVKRRLIIILILMFVVSNFLVLTFLDYDLFFKIWLYDNQETLNNTSL